MLSAGCTIQITLEPPPKGFYVAGDVISGLVDLHVTGMLSITDVQVKLRCDEYSVARYYSDSNRKMREKGRGGLIRPLRLAARQKAAKHLGKAGNFDEDTIDILGNGLRVVREHNKHYQLATNAFSSASDEEKTILSEGHYSYPFSMRVSEAINKCPSHAPIWSEHGLKVGVYWTVKAVVRRPGRFQANVREAVPVPVYPESPYKAQLNFTERKTVCEYRESLRGCSRLSACFSYPTAGITQDRQPIPFKLDVVADGRFDISFIKMALAQTCIAKAQGLKETYSRSLDIALVRGPRIEDESVDLLPYIDPVYLEKIIEPTLALKNVEISYILEVIISVQPHPITLRTPITVLSPADTAAPSLLAHNQAFPPLPPQYSKAAEAECSTPPYPHRSPTCMLPEKSLIMSASANKSDSVKHSAATDDARKPALAPRVPASAPPYSVRPSRFSVANLSLSRPAGLTGPAASSQSADNPDNISAAAAQGQACAFNPWYQGMQQANSIPLPLSQGELHEPDPVLYLGEPQRLALDGTNTTLVGSVNVSETRLPPAEGGDEHAPAGLPSYNDAVGLPNA